MDPLTAEPEVMIVEGQNGTGKTTIMKMIAGAIDLDFDQFRSIPFESAVIEFSRGPSLEITSHPDRPARKLSVTYGKFTADLASDKDKSEYTEDEKTRIELFRAESNIALKSIHYDLLTIDRSLNSNLGKNKTFEEIDGRLVRRADRALLSKKISDFLRDAQVNYKRFFQSEDLDLLPRILARFDRSDYVVTLDDMHERLSDTKERNDRARSFGLQTNEADITVLSELLANENYQNDLRALTLINTYLEVHENNSKSRQLIVDRLVEFEKIMSEFLVGKTVKVHVRDGLIITSQNARIKESDLSSGEYHFLFMMVSALLCQRVGTILAIDEPELSLHVKWQRNLVRALSRCARGASPTFFLSTHSIAISAQYSNKVQRLSAID